jgi:hypothetical protein
LRLIGLVFVVVGICGWLLFAALFRGTEGQDWMVFDTAARAYWHGDAALMLDGARLTQVLNATHPSLQQKLIFRPWVYPPFTLLFVLPFGLVPWIVSYGGFQVLTFAGMAGALRAWVPGMRQFWIVLAGVTLSPAAAYTIGAGQNSFLSAALLLGGVALLGERQIAAGVLLGLLVYKPQLGLLLPVALAAAGAWRAIGSAAVTVLALVLISLLVPGLAIWQGFIHLYLGGQQTPRLWVELYGQSVFTYLRLAGASAMWANAGQAVAIVIGAVAVWRAFRGPVRPLHRMVVLLCAVSFASPHFGDYDAVLLAIAALLVLVVMGSPGRTLRTLVCLAWCSTAINPPYLFMQTIPALFPVAELTPVLLLALLLVLDRSRQNQDVASPAST